MTRQQVILILILILNLLNFPIRADSDPASSAKLDQISVNHTAVDQTAKQDHTTGIPKDSPNSLSADTQHNNLPPLPEPELSENATEQQQNSATFFDKIKRLFGLKKNAGNGSEVSKAEPVKESLEKEPVATSASTSNQEEKNISDSQAEQGNQTKASGFNDSDNKTNPDNKTNAVDDNPIGNTVTGTVTGTVASEVELKPVDHRSVNAVNEKIIAVAQSAKDQSAKNQSARDQTTKDQSTMALTEQQNHSVGQNLASQNLSQVLDNAVTDNNSKGNNPVKTDNDLKLPEGFDDDSDGNGAAAASGNKPENKNAPKNASQNSLENSPSNTPVNNSENTPVNNNVKPAVKENSLNNNYNKTESIGESMGSSDADRQNKAKAITPTGNPASNRPAGNPASNSNITVNNTRLLEDPVITASDSSKYNYNKTSVISSSLAPVTQNEVMTQASIPDNTQGKKINQIPVIQNNLTKATDQNKNQDKDKTKDKLSDLRLPEGFEDEEDSNLSSIVINDQKITQYPHKKDQDSAVNSAPVNTNQGTTQGNITQGNTAQGNANSVVPDQQNTTLNNQQGSNLQLDNSINNSSVTLLSSPADLSAQINNNKAGTTGKSDIPGATDAKQTDFSQPNLTEIVPSVTSVIQNQASITDKSITDSGKVKEFSDNRQDGKSAGARYHPQLEKRLDKNKHLPLQSEEELKPDNNKTQNQTTAASLPASHSGLIDAALQKFINDETQIMAMPDDDIVLGKLTEEGKIALMDFSDYTNLFWSNYDKMKRSSQRESINEFLNNYQQKFHPQEEKMTMSSKYNYLDQAFKLIDNGNVQALILLLSSYPLLSLKSQGDSSLLHEAAYVGNYPAAKLLVIKGINPSARNKQGSTALALAKKYNNNSIVYLLNKAGVNK